MLFRSAHVPAAIAEREIKLGPGGLRDVEFAVQLLQMVHGRTDVLVRSSTTLVALEALSTWGYVGRADASALADAYRFLRTLEHRLQLKELSRTHTFPDDDWTLRVVARSLGFRGDPVVELAERFRNHQRHVRRLHEKLFYRPLLTSVARLDAGEARLTPQAARERLTALGYQDPAGAMRHLQALTSGVSRRASIQRTLLPVMLGWFADGINPDAGLLGFRRISDALGATPWYLRLLRDESVAAERLALVLSSSPYATELLLQAPESVRMLGDDVELVPKGERALISEMSAVAGRQQTATDAITGIRAVRRRELLRIAVAVLIRKLDGPGIGRALTTVARATVVTSLDAVTDDVAGCDGLCVDVAVIGLGRFGGEELGFSSDLDVMFVHEPRAHADEERANRQASAIVEGLPIGRAHV